MGSNKPAAKAATAKKAPANKPAAKKVEPEFIKHIVTQEDLDNNADLVEQGVQVGEEIEIPNPAYKAPGKVKFPEALVATLKEHSHIQNAWVNEEGVWFFAEKPGFTSFSREEILNG